MSDPLSQPTEPIAARPTGAPPVPPSSSTTGQAAEPGQRGRKGAGATSGKGGTAKADDPLRRSRVSGLWIATVTAGILLVLLIIFIVQNTQDVRVDFLGWSGTPPLAVALLVAAAAGILVTGLFGTLRIFQLRRRVKRADR